MPDTRYFNFFTIIFDLRLTILNNNLLLTRTTRQVISSALLAGLVLLLSPPLTIRANGPIPFSENFDDFTAAGFTPDPAPGQLDSDVWIVAGFSDGNISFGDSQTSGDFARGKPTGHVTTGGVYALDTGSNTILAIQPGGDDFTPGAITLRLQNNTGDVIDQLNLTYEIWYFNDQNRANSLNFAYSPDNLVYTNVSSLDFTTPAGAAASPTWQVEPRSTTVTGLNLVTGDFLYLKWLGDDAGGSGSRDEYGLDNIQVTIPTGDSPPDLTMTNPADSAADIPIDANITITFSEPVSLAGDWFAINCDQTGLHTPANSVVSGGPVSWTIDPNIDFAAGESCTVTLFAAQITDQDGTPDQMASDYNFTFITAPAPPAPLAVVINEVAWGGTAANSNHEWIELWNTTGVSIALDGWVITGTNGLNIPLSGAIGPNDYFLLERNNDTAISDIAANLTPGFGSGLVNSGVSLFLSTNGLVIDTANGDGGAWPAGSGSPDYRSMERIDPSLPDADTNWASNDTVHRNGLDANGNPLNGTPKQPNSPTYPPPPPPPPPAPLLISEFLYDGLTPSSEGDEFVEVCNPNPFEVNLDGYKVGDEETGRARNDGGESMYRLPAVLLAMDGCLTIAKDAAQFAARFGSAPDYEVGALAKYTAWGSGSWSLNNSGDELLLLGPNDEILDSVAFRNGDYTALGLEPDATAPEPLSLQRVWPTDTNSMPHDFVHAEPNPGRLTALPPPPAVSVPPAELPGGMKAYWGHLHAHTTYSDGAGPPFYALAMARAAGLHFYGISDHGWWLSQNEWDKTLFQVQAATVPGQFVALRGVEWSPDKIGHINVFNSDTLLQRTDPRFDTLPELYDWLAANPAAIAQFNHPDPRYDGDFEKFTFHAGAAPQLLLQEMGNHAQGYVTYEPAFIQSNFAGWRVGPTNNGDTHTANWGRDTIGRTGVVAPALTEADLLEALRRRRVFSTEDSNLALALRSGDSWMGSILPAGGSIPLNVDFVDPDPEPLTLYMYDTNLLLATIPVVNSTGQWSTTVEARPGHFFWVKAVQADGNNAYTTPLWIEGQLEPERLVLNEILPAPGDWDWDGNGVGDHHDEWIELYNPLDWPVGLGGWRLVDAAGTYYNVPLNVTIPVGGFATFYFAHTKIGLNNSGDTVSLIHPNGRVVDRFSYDHSPGYDESWCRLPDGGPTWSDNCAGSPSANNWEKPPPGPLTVTIFEAKRLTRNAWVRVSGRVTVPPGLFGVRTMYIQDETSGIMVYLPRDHRLADLKLGDKVAVEGKLRSFHEEWEIAVAERGDIKTGDSGEPPPPLPIATTSLLEPYEGMLVMLQGQAAGFKGYTTFWVDDGTDPAKVYLRRSTGIKKPYLEVGTPVTVVGIVSQYSDPEQPSRADYRLLPRYPTDLILPTTAAASPPNWPTELPETGY